MTEVTLQDIPLEVLVHNLATYIVPEDFYPRYWSEHMRRSVLIKSVGEVMVDDEFEGDNLIELGNAVMLKILSSQSKVDEYGRFLQPGAGQGVTEDPLIRRLEVTGA